MLGIDKMLPFALKIFISKIYAAYEFWELWEGF